MVRCTFFKYWSLNFIYAIIIVFSIYLCDIVKNKIYGRQNFTFFFFWFDLVFNLTEAICNSLRDRPSGCELYQMVILRKLLDKSGIHFLSPPQEFKVSVFKYKYIAMSCFTVFHRYCIFFLTNWSFVATRRWSSLLASFFPTAFAHFLSLCHIW